MIAGEYWGEVAEEVDFAQGDVLRRIDKRRDNAVDIGIVITADCDIVQKKAGERYTYVEVVTAERYLDLVWAPEQNQKFVYKQAKPLAEQIGSIMKRSKLEIGMTEDVLVRWLKERSLEDFEQATNKTERPFDRRLVSKLRALQTAAGGGDGLPDGLERWRAVRRELGDKGDAMRAAVRGAFDGEKGFPDYFLLPELPGMAGYGFIAMLRSIRTVSASELFHSELDARIAGYPDALHRVGRLADGIRFAITQKLAFLFSRIGLPSHFEDACQSASELVADSIIIGEY